jgi:hypothetical protein
MKTAAVAVLILAATAVPAMAGGQLPDGIYHCVEGDRVIGDIKVEGENYIGPVTDGNFGGDAEMFIVMDGGKVEWLGALPALEAVNTRVDSTVIRDGGFDMMLLADGAADFVQARCDLQK